MWRLVSILWMLAVPVLGWAAAAPLATVTILDGDAPRVIRDASKLMLAEGVRLFADDIVESSDKTRLLRIEFADGTILDLGPATRLLLAPRIAGGKRSAKVYLLQGFAKLTAAKAAAPAATLASPAFDVSGLTGDVVLLMQPAESYAFAESGDLSLAERSAGKDVGSRRLKAGEFYARGADNKPALAARPAPAFIQRLPRAFLDTLPSRAELFKSRNVEPKPIGAIAYADVQPWIDAEAGLRAGFVTRWKAQARNAEFRKGLVAQIADHPEWDRTLFPEKYLPKPPASSPSVNTRAGALLPASKPYR